MKKLMLVVVIVCSMAGSALAFQSDILDSLDGGSGGPSGNMQDWDWGQCPGSVN